MPNQNNEGKACDAVLRFLEQRTGESRAGISHPEKDGNGPPVDLRVSLGAAEYAIEHTRIEAFPDQIRQQEEFGQFILPVIEELSGTLPGPGIYHLHFPMNARLGINAAQREKARSEFIEWVRDHAACLHEKNPERPTREANPRGITELCRGRPPGFPYEVTLRHELHWSLSPRHDGVLSVARIAPEDVEPLRADRLRTALNRKCPKLHQCKEGGARTVLVLEDSDIALSNYALIGGALEGILAERPDLPDEIFLIDTSMDRWDVRRITNDEAFSLVGDVAEFNSAELDDIT